MADSSFDMMVKFEPPPSSTSRSHFGLRRRILLLVLLLVFLPSFLTLIIMTGFSVATIRSLMIDQARNRLLTQSERLGDELQAEMAALRAVAQDAELLADIEGWVEAGRPGGGWVSAISSAQPTAPGNTFFGRQLYILTEEGSVGEIVRRRIVPHTPSTPDSALASVVHLLEREKPTEPFGIQIRDDSVAEMELWMVAPLGEESTNRRYWLALPMVSPTLERLMEQQFGDDGERIVLVSAQAGVLGDSTVSGEIRQLVLENPEIFTQQPAVLKREGVSGLAWPTVRVGAMANLGRPVSQDLSLVLIQRVELDAPTTMLYYRLWQLVLAGAVFAALVGALGIWLSDRLVNPILRLRTGFQKLEMGFLDYRIKLHTGDELEELAESVNRMAGTLQQTYQDLASKLLELDEKARQLAITHEIATAVSRSLELDTLFHDVVGAVGKLVPAERLFLGLLPETRDKLDLAYAWPADGWNFGEKGILQLASSRVAECLAEKRVLVFTLEADGERPEEQALADSGMVTLCAVPLRGMIGPVGVLLLADSDPNAFRAREIDVLDRISPGLATAVEHSRLYAKQAQFAAELERQVVERTRELQKAQEQLVAAEKFAASGEIAANVAHEINNPLSIIKNYLKLLQGNTLHRPQTTEDAEMVREGMTIIGEEIDRIARIVDQLKRLHQPSSPDSHPVELNEELTVLSQLFRQTLTQKKLEMETRFDPALKTVHASSDYLRQVVINLLRNAADATEPGGQIILETRGDTPEIGWYTILCRDTGSGIHPENLKKIFDPFFTTKKEGKGTGLGLSVSYGLVRNMGGRMEVSSPGLGKGTEFRVVLPIGGHGANAVMAHTPVIRRQGGKIIIG